jgi:K+-sensing histidine kinase KdpD
MDRTRQQFTILRKSSLILFPVVSVLIAWSTSSIRESIGVANVALVLAIVTTCAALLRWEAGIITSLAAASTLNFFHTEPVHSFRITSQADLVMITLLIMIGLGVSFITASRVRGVVQQFHSDTASDLLKVNVQLLQGVSPQLPIISRRPGLSDGDDELVLPETGAVMKFNDPRIQSVLLVTPHPGIGSLSVSRRTMNAFADHVETVIQ